jgi:hypothetical protein
MFYMSGDYLGRDAKYSATQRRGKKIADLSTLALRLLACQTIATGTSNPPLSSDDEDQLTAFSFKGETRLGLKKRTSFFRYSDSQRFEDLFGDVIHILNRFFNQMGRD